ncbi:hypothetical protein AB0F17_17115 [Nonomuraea sp. NPDC026600]|uniref:hypothetical protein n=1 Tax=Nonomuraea sp. NPDC026600 TaxID=3155363 RepID=UPI0033F07175
MTPARDLDGLALGECASRHVRTLRRDHLRVEWALPLGALERLRPLAWTCACRATVYELCSSGSKGLIRRTVQHSDGHVVHETQPMSINDAWTLWAALLDGTAR